MKIIILLQAVALTALSCRSENSNESQNKTSTPQNDTNVTAPANDNNFKQEQQKADAEPKSESAQDEQVEETNPSTKEKVVDYEKAIASVDEMKKEAVDLDVSMIDGAESHKQDILSKIEDIRSKLEAKENTEEVCAESFKLESVLNQLGVALVIAQGMVTDGAALVEKKNKVEKHLSDATEALLCKKAP